MNALSKVSAVDWRNGKALRNRVHRFGELTSRVQRQAQERAAELARRVPWQVLLETRNQYLAWQEFYFWARSIIESEGAIPEWLARRLNEMCPGFLDAEEHKAGRDTKAAAFAAIRLGEWIDNQIFAFAEKGGWLPAVTFYAVREPRYQRASVCWSESVQKWRTTKPHQYPSLDGWRLNAAACDESAHLLPEIRKQRDCFKLVDQARLVEAVTRYIDWEAFAYWARPAMEQESVVDAVVRELDARCPGFREFNAREKIRDAELPKHWHRLMLWIRDHFFQEAKTEGWLDAVVMSAGIHPRAIRTMEFADHCDDLWSGELPVPYPSFGAWRRDADRYVDTASPCF
jgi:hypothetical protein